MFSELFKSLSAYGPAWRAMSKYKLWKYVWISGIISVTLTGLVVGFALSYADDLGRFFAERYPWDWGAELVAGLGTFLAAFLMLVLVAFAFKYVVMVLVAPFMGLLSEELEHKLTGVAPPKFDGLQLFKDMLRGLRIALRNILREILYTLLVTLVGFIIPVIGNLVSTAIVILSRGILLALATWTIPWSASASRFRKAWLSWAKIGAWRPAMAWVFWPCFSSYLS